MKLRNLLHTYLLLVALAIWTSPTVPAQSFEVETVTRTFVNTQPNIYSLGYHHFQGDGSTGTYTRGQGATNLSYSYTGWWTTENIVSPYGLLGYSWHSTNIWEWTWDTANNSLSGGAWFTEFNRVTNRYVLPTAPWVRDLVTINDRPRRYENTLSPFRDFTSDFSGPVGTITNVYLPDNTMTTDTYTTTAGIFVPGDPASTNEHFYRVRLSLEYSDRTPISVPYFISSYLGQVPDADTNVYVWLGEGKSYTAKPVFKTASPPSFYSYGAEVTPAQQLGTLVISTIAEDENWPGNRPDGILGRMNYPGGETPSDDQMILDLLLNTSGAPIVTSGVERFLPLGWYVDSSRGKLTNLSVEDRKWLTLLLLSRSTNADPQVVFSYDSLQTFVDNTRFTYRLINELSIEALANNGGYSHVVAGKNVLRRQSKLGQTALQFWNPVKLNIRFLAFPSNPIPMPLLELNALFRGFSARAVHNAAGAYHNQLIGGQKGSTYIVNTCSGHAGTLLRSVEAPILQQQAPDFYIKIFYRIPENAPDTIERDFMYSGYPNTIWPTMFEYHYNFVEKVYERYQKHNQSATPFAGFLSIE